MTKGDGPRWPSWFIVVGMVVIAVNTVPLMGVAVAWMIAGGGDPPWVSQALSAILLSMGSGVMVLVCAVAWAAVRDWKDARKDRQ